jgi:hypothetical protein
MHHCLNGAFSEAAAFERLNVIMALMEGLLALLVILLEFYCNITLIITSLRLMSKDIKAKPAGGSDVPDFEMSNPSGKCNNSKAHQQIVAPATQLLLLKIKEYRKLKFKMFAMFAAMALLDVLTLVFAGCATLRIFPNHEALLIVSSICGLHIFVSFSLLDLFLVELNRIKRLTAPKAMIPLKKTPLHIDLQSQDTPLPANLQESAIEIFVSEDNSYSAFSAPKSVIHLKGKRPAFQSMGTLPADYQSYFSSAFHQRESAIDKSEFDQNSYSAISLHSSVSKSLT